MTNSPLVKTRLVRLVCFYANICGYLSEKKSVLSVSYGVVDKTACEMNAALVDWFLILLAVPVRGLH